MAARRTRKAQGAVGIAADLMLAPMVMWMRIPVMAMERRSSTHAGVETMMAINEKTAAMAEGAMAAQMSLMEAATRFWPDVISGKAPAALGKAAAEQALNAALLPAGRAVRANYKRLSRKS